MSRTTPVAAAATELLARRHAREDLIDFTTYTFPGFEVARHHSVIASKLEAVERGEIDRLMIFCPPRHSKSELASRRFPAWFLGRHPGNQIICCSYGDDLAHEFGRDVRNIVAGDEFSRVYPNVSLAPDSKAANRWKTAQGGSYLAAGVGSGITGRGAHVLLIDDPHKDRAEANSQTVRDGIWNWYRATAYTRLMPGGAIVLIQTRWHEDDLAGRLLQAQENGGDRWEVVSLYQQEPQAEEGDFFQRGWIRWYPWGRPPENVRVYGASDYAVTSAGGDYTVHLVVGVDEHDDIYVLDLWREQASSDVWVESFLDLVERWKPLQWAEEKGQIEKGVGPFLDQRVRERGVYTYRVQFASAADKPTRAQAIRGRLSMGKVWFPEGAPWTDDLVGELTKFPAGSNDDQVDTLSLLGRMRNEIIGAPALDDRPKEPEEDCYLRAKRRMMRKGRKPWFVCEGYGRDWRLG